MHLGRHSAKQEALATTKKAVRIIATKFKQIKENLLPRVGSGGQVAFQRPATTSQTTLTIDKKMR